MDIRIEPDYLQVSEVAAARIMDVVRRKSDALLVLPAGETPLGIYDFLVKAQVRGEVDLRCVTIFALDEWGGRDRQHSLSCHQAIARALVRKCGIPSSQFHSLDGIAPNPEEECRRYTELFEGLGPPTLTLVGLGTNGHVGFNEPAEHLPLKAYPAALAPATLARAERELGDEPVAPYGLTLSLAQIMSAQEVVLVASGSHKAQAMSSMLCGDLTTRCPASLLHLHPAANAIIDKAAAMRIT
jgi:glucosamine-6-phosphate deaminase